MKPAYETVAYGASYSQPRSRAKHALLSYSRHDTTRSFRVVFTNQTGVPETIILYVILTSLLSVGGIIDAEDVLRRRCEVEDRRGCGRIYHRPILFSANNLTYPQRWQWFP